MDVLMEKFKEVLTSVLPIVILIIILSLFLVPMPQDMIVPFIVGTISIILGLTIFLFGIEIGVEELGNQLGHTIASKNKLWYIAVMGLILGFIITAAEPDLHILANQISTVTGGGLSVLEVLLVVSSGVAIMVMLGLLRIVFNWSVRSIIIISYLLIFVLGVIARPEYLAIAVDSSGATTGSMTVPFILSLGLGVSALKHGGDSDDSFGLLGIASAGPIWAILLISVLKGNQNLADSATGLDAAASIHPLGETLLTVTGEILLAIAPLVLILIVFQKREFHFTRRHLSRISKGLFYSFIGLTLFLTGVNSGFLGVGIYLGAGIAEYNSIPLLVFIGFIFGLAVILAEPAVYTLTRQVEDVSAGIITRKMILVTLSIGVGLAVGLSMLRISLPQLALWHFLLPGFGLALILTKFVSPLFVGIAYDSGGVASGPMTATFILAFAQGAAEVLPQANVMVDGFGVIAMVAMVPIVAIQILGLIFRIKQERGGEQE